MISAIIKDSIHKIIRKNNLPNLIIWFAYGKSGFLDKYIEKIKKLLNQDFHLNPGSPKKYILYVQYLKKEYKDLNDKEIEDILVQLFSLYTIPKKRNNLYIIFLLYYYLNNHNISEEKAIFQMIYFYYIIIVYRNRFPLDIRQKLVNIDTLKFKPMHTIIKNKFILYLLKLNNFFKKYKIYYLIFFICVIGIAYYLFPGYIKADINGKFSSDDVKNTLMNSMMFYSPSQDFLNKMIGQGDNYLYLIGFFGIIMFLQVFRDVIKNTIINDNLQNIIGLFKKIFHIIFYIYNTFIVFFTTRFILYVITFVLKFNINITGFFLFIFSLFYLFVYVFIIGVYFFAFVFIFHLHFLLPYAFQTILLASLILIGINLISDYKNFEKFLIGINDFIQNTKKE